MRRSGILVKMRFLKVRKLFQVLVITVACTILVWAVSFFKKISPKHHHRDYVYNKHLSFSSQTTALTFPQWKALPYFYRTISTHKNDIFKERTTVHVNCSKCLLQTGSMKLILFYNVPTWARDYTSFFSRGLKECPINKCQFSENPAHFVQADAVVIDGVELSDPQPPKKHTNQVWIFYGIEPPTLYLNQHIRSKAWRDVFNWTMTYRLDSDVVAPYDVLVRQADPSKKNFTDIALRKSKSALWLVGDCKTQSKREEYVKELGKYYDVDIFGRCGPQRQRSKDDLDVLQKDYRFYLSFENTLSDDYFTEKVFKIYDRKVDLIPIVRGSVDYNSLLPKGTFIDTASFESPKELAAYLQYLEENTELYAEMLSRKDQYTRGGDFAKLSSPFCDICIKLHNLNIFSNHYSDITQWLERDVVHEPNDYW